METLSMTGGFASAVIKNAKYHVCFRIRKKGVVF